MRKAFLWLWSEEYLTTTVGFCIPHENMPLSQSANWIQLLILANYRFGMKLGTKGRYAVMAMADLAARQQNGPVKLDDIASRQDLSLSYLEQLFAKLRRANLVKSIRGPGGGYALARDADKILISDIVMAVDEELDITRCGHQAGGCLPKGAKCATHHLWHALTEEIYGFLNRISLADVLSGQLKGPQTETSTPAAELA